MRRDTGFTLVEMIVVIVITGILASVVAVVIVGPVQSYVDSTRRAGLSDMADLALKRMALEIRTALPNTVVASGGFVQFLPATGGGRYCSDSAPDTCTNPLTDFNPSDAIANPVTFDVLGPMPTAADGTAIAVGDRLVIYNTGQAGLDVYNNDNCRTITNATATTLSYNATAFPYASPSNRFFFLAANASPVRFSCTANQVTRIQGGVAFCGVNPAATTTVLAAADSVNCDFTYNAITATNGLLVLSLTLTNAGESVRLMHQIHVDNMP